MDDLLIRKALSSDIKALSNLAKTTFYNTWIHENNESDMRVYLDQTFSDEALRKQLLNPNIFFDLLFFRGDLVGYLKCFRGANFKKQMRSK